MPMMSRRTRYTDDEILDMLRACRDEHEKCTPRHFREHDEFCSVSTVMKRFGSWSEAKEEAGVSRDHSSETGRRRQYTDEQILSNLRECHRRNDKVTVKALSEEDDLVSPTTVVDRFGSWLSAKKEAGIEVDERNHNSRPREFSDEDYLEALRECQSRHGKCTQRLFDEEEDLPSSGAIRKRFGSWGEAKEIAGLGSDKKHYTDDELLTMLQRCAEKHGSCTARRFASDNEFCSPETVLRHFGSWTEAKRLAGLVSEE
jgi:transposase